MSLPQRVTIESVAHGGQGVVRIDGKVHFVPDALPGSTVSFEVEQDKGRWARGRLIEVIEPGPHAADPVCQHATACGGCQWQHADLHAQRDWKRRIVIEQLERIGRIDRPPVNLTKGVGPAFGYRNRMDFQVDDGRLALHARRSRERVTLNECPLIHPSIEQLIDACDWTGSASVTFRTGVRTGDRLIVLDGTLPEGADRLGVPICRTSPDGPIPLIGEPHLSEVVAGMRFRITGSAFFQNNTDGADALAELVAAAAGRGSTLLDLYAGGGLFSCTIGRRFDRVVAVESAGLATSDFLFNAAGLDHVRLVRSPVERSADVLAEHAGAVVVADPPRAGLGSAGVDAILGARPERIVLVSCDPGSLGRDAGLLAAAGYHLVESTPLDMFPHTFHVEVVSRFEPA